MANCVRCGRKLPAFSLGKISDTCSACLQEEAAEPGDAPGGEQRSAHSSLRRVTPATSTIIGINVLVLAGMLITSNGKALIAPSSEVLLRWGADYGPLTFAAEPWRSITSMWVHAGVLHLFLNMWCLDNYGRVAERLFSWRFYLTIYTLAGLCGSIGSLAWHPNTVSAGASAAIFGVVGALLLPLKSGRLPQEALRKGSKSLLTLIGYNLLFGMMLPAIDNAAHVGGLFGGFALGAIWTRVVPEKKGRILRVTVLAGVVMVGAFFAVRHFRAAPTFGRQALHMLRAGHTDEAIALATAAVEYDDHDAMAHVVLGWVHVRKNETEAAVEEFEKAIAAAPHYEYALSQLGLAYGRLGRESDAVQVLERAVKLDKDDSQAWANLGVGYANTGRPEEAVKALRTAVQKDPHPAFALDNLGIVLEGRQEIDPAIDSFREALRLEPENAEYRTHLADALEGKGLHEEAEKVRRKTEPSK